MPANSQVIFVVIDGVRREELAPGAVDDDGLPLFPNLHALRTRGVFFPNMKISNPVGISLPAYADIFTGRRQESVVDNSPKPLSSPTIFELVENVALIASWSTLERIVPDEVFVRAGGAPEKYAGSCADAETYRRLLSCLETQKPKFTFVHFGDADEEGHRRDFRLYLKALREVDAYVGKLAERDDTILIVATDHGRDIDDWAEHGACVERARKLCEGCESVFGLVVGPGFSAREMSHPYTHLDWAPTIARWFGVAMPTAIGVPIAELL